MELGWTPTSKPCESLIADPLGEKIHPAAVARFQATDLWYGSPLLLPLSYRTAIQDNQQWPLRV